MPLMPHIFIYLMVGAFMSWLVPWEEMEVEVEEDIPAWMRVAVGALWPLVVVIFFFRIAVGR